MSAEDAAREKARQLAKTRAEAAAKEEAKLQAEKLARDKAEKEAEESRLAAEAARVRSAVEAEAQKLINEAENILTDGARRSLFKRNMLNRLEGIISAQVKPLEKIQEIKIMQLGGSGTTGLQWADGEGPQGGGASVGPGGSPTDEVINSALRYRVQAPMIDSLMNDIGIDGSNLAKSAVFQDANNMARAMNESAKLAATKKAEADKKDGEAKG